MAAYPDRTIPGMEILTPEPPHPWALIVRADKRQTEWRIFSDRLEDKLDPQSAPTVILYWDAAYRIEREVLNDDGWTYFMRPWPEHATMFHRYELSNASIESRKLEQKEMRDDIRKAEVAIFYDYLVGFLPSRTQYQLSETMGFDPIEATRHSAILGYFVGFALCFGGWIFGIPFQITFSLGLLFFLDGLARWAWVITGEKANGFLILELIDHIPTWIASITKRKPPADIDPYEPD